MPRPKSALLSLPRELRDLIYGYLLTTEFQVKTPHKFQELFPFLRYRPNTHLAILNVSKSTYEEGQRVLYRKGHFRFDNSSVAWPHLYDGFHNLPAIKLLQNITLHIGLGAIVRNELVFGQLVARFITSFADSDSEAAVPRNRCVVEVELLHDGLLRCPDPYITAADLTDVLDRLTGFKTVEVAVWYPRTQYRLESAEEVGRTLHNAFVGLLTAKLGEMENKTDKRYFRWIYHSHRG